MATSANRSIATRIPSIVLIVTTIASSWLLMQIVHESGHVLGGWITGAQVRRVILVPWQLSRTDLLENPQPLIVCWAGPIVGAMAPFAIWLVTSRLRWAIAFWLRFLAGFCCVANGTYIAVGRWTHDGDAGDLLHYGAPAWTLLLFGIVTTPIGFLLWHGLGKSFGLGPEANKISLKVAGLSTLTFCVIVVVELFFA